MTRLSRARIPAVLRILILVLSISLPVTAQSVIVVEGEDAVSTNFAADSVLLYGAGQNRTLQLNEKQQISAGSYYADLVFFAEEGGPHTFWYGGSFPGSREALAPSYGSPFVYSINDGVEVPVFWEDVRWGDFYSVPYAHVRVGEVILEPGMNRIRIEVREKRRFDASFFFYLDRIVFVPVAVQPAETGLLLPPEESLRDSPESIEDMLIRIRENSQDIDAYLRVAEFYTLLGDNINAIRYLNRVSVLEPGNPRILLLQARNNVWRGDINAGLESYWRLVGAAPARIDGFLEAGKIAAWSGFYAASEQYYLSALEHHPESPEVLANLGFTYLWWNRQQRAREVFRQAEQLARVAGTLIELGRVYEKNDDLERAVELYRRRLAEVPEDEELYLALLDALYRSGQAEEAAAMARDAPARLPEYAAVAARFQRISRTYAIRAEVLSQYEDAVQADPFDLDRRRVLAQTYFWIGRRTEGISETENILVIEAQQKLRGFVANVQDVIWSEVLGRTVRDTIRAALPVLSADSSRLAAARNVYEKASRQEGGDTRTPGEEMARTIASVENDLILLSELSDLYAQKISGTVPDVQASAEVLETEMDSIRESLKWDPPMDRLLAEFTLASTHNVPGGPATTQLLLTLRGRQPLWEGVLTTDAGEELGRILGESRAGAITQVFDHSIKLEAGYTAESDRFTDLLLLLELQGPAIRSLIERSSASVPVESNGQPAAATMTPAQAYERVDDVRQRISDSTRELTLLLRQMDEDAGVLERYLALQTDRDLFALQNETAALRNRLGTYYLDQDRTESAVQQFETVLAVDPGNLEARYSLANAYRQLGRWRQAQDAFTTIYSADPNYRNTVRIHNEIARQYADILTAGVVVVNEGSRQEANTDLSYLWQVRSNLGMRAGFSYSQYRLRINAGEIRRHAYQDVRARLGVPVRLLKERIRLEPFLQSYMVGNQLYTVSPAGSPVDVVSDAGDYFQTYTVSPGWGVSAGIGAGIWYLSGDYEYGVYRPVEDIPPVTAVVERPEASAHTINIGAGASLSGVQNPVVARFDFGTAAKAELIEEDSSFSGTRYSVTQDISFRTVDRVDPFTKVETALSASYESYEGETSPWFYEPDSIFQAGGSAGLRMYRAAGPRHVWGLVARLYGGLYQTAAFSGDAANGVRFSGDLLGELTRDNVAFQVSVNYNASTTSFDSLDYYALTVGLQTVVRNFRLLAQ